MATPAPSWFNDAAYLANKLLQLQSSDPSTGWTLEMLNAELAKYNATPYEHFLAQGDKENVSPNAYFNVSEYLKAKAVQMNGISYEGKTDWSEASVLAVMSKYGVSAWDHYLAVGQFEGINPSNALDTGAYFTAKMNLLNSVAYGGRTNWTVSDVQKIFKDAGCSPITDPSPNVAVTAVAADKQVQTSYNPYAPNVAGKTFALTADVDTVVGTAANDTGTGTSATLQAGDTILDQSTADKDVLNLTLNAVNPAARITNIENINVTWDSFSDAAFVATNVTGSTLTLSSSKVGFLGNATVTDAGSNNVVAGSGMIGTLTVTGVKSSTINAGSAKTVTVAGTAGTTDSVKVLAGGETTTVTVAASVESANVVAGAKTTAVTTNAVTATIDASAAAKDAVIIVNGTGGSTDAATVKLGNDATVTSTALTGTEKLTLNVADGKIVTLTGLATPEVFEVQGSGAATLKIAAANLDGDTVTKSNTGNLTVEVTTAKAALDLEDVAASLFKLTAAGATVSTVKSGANVEVSADLAAGGFTVAGTGTSDSVNVTFTKTQGTSTTFTGVETANIVAAATQAAAPTVTDLTFASLVNAGNTVTLSGTNDVKVTSLDVKTLDASSLNGELVVSTTAAGATDVTIAGAQGKNDVTFNAAAVKAAFIGQSAADKVNFGTLAAAAAATAVTGAGNDEVTVNVGSLTTGSLAVEAGAGDDVVNLNGAVAATTGIIVLQFGEGTDTLKLGSSADLTAANLTITGLEKLVVNGVGAAGAQFTGAQLTGKTLVVEGSTINAADTITVKGTVAAGETIDLSGLTGTDSVSTGIKGAVITGNAGADVIIGTNRDDVITGGAGNDTLTGGAGNDTFALSGPTAVLNGKDTITDFTGAGVAGGDVIQLSKAAFSLTSIVGNGFSLGTEFASVADDAAVETSAALVVFSQATGTVFFNATVGVNDAVALVTLTGVNNLAAGDFAIVA